VREGLRCSDERLRLRLADPLSADRALRTFFMSADITKEGVKEARSVQPGCRSDTRCLARNDSLILGGLKMPVVRKITVPKQSNINPQNEEQDRLNLRIQNTKIECVPIGDLTPNPRNAKKHPKQQIDLLVENYKLFGFTQPIIIDEDDRADSDLYRLLADGMHSRCTSQARLARRQHSWNARLGSFCRNTACYPLSPSVRADKLHEHNLSCCRPQRTIVYTSYIRSRRASMIVEFCRWGNSLAVRIPKAVADALKVSNGKRAEIKIENGTLVLRPILKPARKPRYTLDELLSGMTRDNVPQEVDWGPQRGNEAW
jgi:antitoxin MazE